LNQLPGPNSNLRDILKSAERIKGKTLKEFVPSNVEIKIRNKGSVGNLIETYGFGIDNNGIAEPDFISEGIELKTLPLEKSGKALKIKERTKICSINYKTLPEETWSESHARSKLNKILFIFTIHNEDPRETFIKDFTLYSIEKDESILRKDWLSTYEMVKSGNAHNLSESIANYLSPSRSGSGGKKEDGTPRDLVDQYKNAQPRALKRAFSLKTSYTNTIFQENVVRKKFTSLSEIDFNGDESNVIPFILSKINSFTGQTLYEFAIKNNLTLNKGKANTAQLIRASLGLKGNHENVREFRRIGLKIKVVPINKGTLMPYESMSFPRVKFSDVMYTDFWDCSLLEQIDNILMLPISREERDNRGGHEVLEKAFLWRPTKEQLEIIEGEYNLYQQFFIDIQEVAKKGVDTKRFWEENFIRSSSTKILHMRPHARNKKDIDTSIKGVVFTKQSFWLNNRFVQTLIEASR
jgi:DNA mismatch repair protein MutH